MTLKNTLISNGWKENNIKIISGVNATMNNLTDGITNWLAEKVQPMDTALIYIRTHGDAGGNFYDYNLTSQENYSVLDSWLDQVKSTNMALLIEACYSEKAIDPNKDAPLVDDGRVIITSHYGYDNEAEMANVLSYGLDVFGDYCPGYTSQFKGNKDGATSLEEAYNYSQYDEVFDCDEYTLKDCYPTINNSEDSELHLTFQNWTNGRVDQHTNHNLKYTSDDYQVKWYNNNSSMVAQHFKPTGTNLTKIRILMKPNADPEHEIRVSIKNDLDGIDIVSCNISADDMDPYSHFITFDFNMSPTSYSYYFVCKPTDEENNTYQYYNIIYGLDNYGYDEYSAYEWKTFNPWWKPLKISGERTDLRFVTYSRSINEPPHTPKRPGGPNNIGVVNQTYDYYICTTDPDGDNVTYNVSWGNDTYEEYGPYSSGEIICINHTWETSGDYFLKLKAKDEHNNSGNWSDVYVVTIIYNEAPEEPTIEGPINGKAGITYNYTFNSTDPDGDNVSYTIKWGDGNTTTWTSYQASGTAYSESHTWASQGTYTIEAKAKDIYGVESDWSTLVVTMPKNIFGYTSSNVLVCNIKNKITGSNFTVEASGIADNITAYIQTNLSIPPRIKCLISRNNDSTLIGTTEEKILNTGDDGAWVTFNFSDPKPTLVKDMEYVLACWSNDTCNLSYDNIIYDFGLYKNHTYGTELNSPINWTSNESRNYSIFCRYTTIPKITNVSNTQDTAGFGFNITISACIDDNGCGIENATVDITYPDNTTGNFTMDYTGNNTYQYIFNDTWLIGQYNYTIWAVDKSGSVNSSSGHIFNVSAQATISVCTLKDSYGNNETINLTDPPGDPPLIGYELLDNGNVLHIWNKYDSYYFDTNSGIQITNHYDEYWSHNVLMLGYYNNNEWNLIYRTDELSGFNKGIDSDDVTYVNVTLWKDLTYQGYDFRLAIRYYLGVDDNELTVIPYIKNIDDEDIPYILGFGWEMKDIQIDMTPGGDYINVNQTMYYLDQTLNNIYTNLSESEFYLMENITDTSTKSLYLRWNQSLTYKLQVKSRTGQYNATVTFFVKIGTLDAGQEKHTKMYWYDADQATYYFNSYNVGEAWATNPSYMVNGNPSNNATTTVDGDIELCNGNNCTGSDIGTISQVELRVSAFYNDDYRDTILRPVFGGATDGEDYRYSTPPSTGGPPWSQWFDITYDPFAPASWSWSDIVNLDCDVEAGDVGMFPFTLYCSQVEIRVTYTPYTLPGISNPYPADGATGISIAPMLNITVSDAGGDSMNITWLSNSSGSWVAFGWNNSVGNGTYHQSMSNASVNGQWWYWKVNVSDETNFTMSSVYKFYTGCESKIENMGSTNISGYLLVQLQYYKESSEEWVVDFDIVNETTPRVINSGEHLALDSVANGLVNTRNLSYGNATYRVYVALRDKKGKVLESYDGMDMDMINGTFEFKFYGPWRQLIKDGFGSDANVATRSMERYNDELYVGTQNVNFYGLTDLFWDLFEELSISEISELDSAEEYNDFMTTFLDDHDLDIEVNMSEDEFNETNSTVIQIIREYKDDINSSETAEEFDELMVSMFENESLNDGVETYFYECELFGIGKWFNPFTLFGSMLSELVCFFSDGCEVWKYNDDTKAWTQMIGDNPEAMKKAGFGKKTNCVASTLKVFDDELYVGTWNSMRKGSCEVWRYDGTDWEKVVGNDSIGEPGGFGEINNVAVWSIEEFGDYLYAGTLNTDFSEDGCCQVWRTQNGEDWFKVVDKGFRPDGAHTKHKNVYAWRMEVFQGKLYVGTFNAQLLWSDYKGCQLWRSSSGDYGTWSKVPLSDNNIPDQFKDGFGEHENWGIRTLVVYDNELYVGTATSIIQEDEALEIWKYDGTDWYPVIGDDVEEAEKYEEDGFGDYLNKYAWSNTIADGKLWIGTANGLLHLSGLDVETEGCEVWCYDGTDWERIVEDEDGEKPNGFGYKENEGARDMIEYPTGSGNIIVGTFKAVVEGFIEPEGNQRGCEIWRRKATGV